MRALFGALVFALAAIGPMPSSAVSSAGGVPSPSLHGEADVASDLDVNLVLQPAWGKGEIPPTAAPDVVGSFRFICGAGQIRPDDPIVYPGEPGKSHLHQFYGNTAATASSTYRSLRSSGDSTCNWTGKGMAANRSAYWQPAMLDGKGHVVRPDFVGIYYKRRPASDPKCSLSSGDPKAEGNCLPLPNGLRYIFGFDLVTLKPPTGGMYFNCQGPGSVPGHYATISELVGKCPAGAQFGFIISAPPCWDGKRLDSANHRDHMAYPGYGNWGYLKCDADHPYVLPTFTLQAWYTVAAGDDLRLWHFSSDEMHPELAHGLTGHADWFGAWDNKVTAMWTDAGCIGKMLNCSGGDLGNGKQLKGAAKPKEGWKANPRLVPVP
jgi:hypothetical protein